MNDGDFALRISQVRVYLETAHSRFYMIEVVCMRINLILVIDRFQRRCTDPAAWNCVDRALLIAAEPFLHLYAELPVLGFVVARCPPVLCAVPAMLNEVLMICHLFLFLLNYNVLNLNIYSINSISNC